MNLQLRKGEKMRNDMGEHEPFDTNKHEESLAGYEY